MFYEAYFDSCDNYLNQLWLPKLQSLNQDNLLVALSSIKIIIIHWNTNEHKKRIANEKVEKNQSSARALNSRALIFLNVASTHKMSKTMITYPRPSVTKANGPRSSFNVF